MAEVSATVRTGRKGNYVTQLGPQEEAMFQQWVMANKIPWMDEEKADYDMRGFWKAQQMGDPNAVRNAANAHFPDTWKTPYHKTFSAESIYADLRRADRNLRHCAACARGWIQRGPVAHNRRSRRT